MLLKAAGVSALLVFGALLAVGVWSVVHSADNALHAGVVVRANGQELDVADYQQHWLVTSVAFMFASAIGLIAGASILMRRPWALRVLALSFGCFLSFAVWKTASGYVRYAFEVVSVVEFPMWLVRISLVIVWGWRLRRVRHAWGGT